MIPKHPKNPFGGKPKAEQPSEADFLADELAKEQAKGNAHEHAKEQARAQSAYTAQDPYLGGGMPPYTHGGFGAAGGLFAEPGESVGDMASPSATKELLLSPEQLEAQFRDKLCSVCLTKKEADEARLRALAEVDNAKKRMEREKDEHVRFAAESVLNSILPALDNLDLALQHAPAEGACKNFVMGVEMTRKLMIDSLKKHGLEQVGEVGQPFDPNLHEAVGMTDAPDVADGSICALLGCGYRLRDRLLRPARVMVCKKG